MPFTGNGKYYSARAERWCKRCGTETEQDMVMNRMRCTPQPTVPLTYIREQEWYCTQCDNIDQVTKTVTEPTDKQRIFNRLLRLTEDYEIENLNIESRANELLLRVKLPDYDMSELRAVQYKQQETGFITVDELLLLQKAGYRRPSEVPPKPQPKDKRVLKERAKQRMFQGEPRSI